eukprot:TRINITY_DN11109_c0_g1_i1.p1 TRINITY_DN11109_c0_g1~~TRINITY_DN11109_c0_g1_i1.p1  ORF type:complete len:110 (-),score=13.92 TRINITY_DN11109_c0_g1_i1:154-483(-)
MSDFGSEIDVNNATAVFVVEMAQRVRQQTLRSESRFTPALMANTDKERAITFEMFRNVYLTIRWIFQRYAADDHENIMNKNSEVMFGGNQCVDPTTMKWRRQRVLLRVS